MQKTKQNKRDAQIQARSSLESKEESALNTTYDKIVDKVEMLLSIQGLTFISDHRDYNSDQTLSKKIRIVRKEQKNESEVPSKLAEFEINSKSEYNFLNRESPKIDLELHVYGPENMELLKEFAQNLGRVLNANMELMLWSFDEQLIKEFGSQTRKESR